MIKPSEWASSTTQPPFRIHVVVNGNLFFDILTRLGDAAIYETVESEVIDIEGIRVHTATPQALYKLKKDTVRPIDRQDAAAIRERFNLRDE